MAVAAYASLVSLTDVLESIQHPARRHRLHLDKKQLQSLQQKVHFLQDFLELHSQRISPEMEDLARQLALVADEADDVIDFHVVNQLRERSQAKTRRRAAVSSFRQEINKIVEKIDSITEKLIMVEEERVDVQEQQPIVSVSVGSTALTSIDKNTMVGFDELLLQVVDELTRDESNLQILPIVGMGGIGKTTLAQNAFDHQHIVNRFDIRIWFTISQQYSVREILLKYFPKDEENKQGKSLAELGVSLHKHLFGKRYLIIMDDVWSIKAWDDFKLFFPNDGNGSRILITNRLLDVARPLCFNNHYFTMNFLDEDNSWNLLCEKTFAKKRCPYPELEEIGRNIARCCRGLPLAIVVIGGLLANSKKTREYWEFLVENITSFINFGDDDYCLKILSLSYNSLPIHLKPCFLYMRVFPEDDEIEVSKLIAFWIGEGFLKPIRGKTLKEAAKEYLKDLADRNLILIRKWTRTGKIKTCGVHDILRELCFRESEREHLIRVPKTKWFHNSVPMEDVCFLCSHKLYRQNKIHLEEVVNVGLQSTTVASPSVCEACNNKYQNLNNLRWVKVLIKLSGDECDVISPLHTKLGYLRLGIWEMPKLRHFTAFDSRLPDPVEGQDSTVLENLSTLKLNKLESLTIYSRLKDIAFPASLKKLSLNYSRLPWEKMTIIGSSLPNLEVFKFYEAFQGEEWSPIEGEFLRLKVLVVGSHNLERWGAEDIHFPNLHVLYLEHMQRLEIPLSIGDINTLQSIHLSSCNECTINSAVEIVKDQKEKGNESLQVYVNGKQVDEEQVC
ncbi:putative disease resistance protein [Sesamum angolense]|uniref:Disease resistance protein n=1 Tax=Sesamum angolense TaxID=2727404 RepID=A0AAE1T4G5_9LAMI|nr:putative disease resistance protein [Sesamum angolense]